MVILMFVFFHSRWFVLSSEEQFWVLHSPKVLFSLDVLNTRKCFIYLYFSPHSSVKHLIFPSFLFLHFVSLRIFSFQFKLLCTNFVFAQITIPFQFSLCLLLINPKRDLWGPKFTSHLVWSCRTCLRFQFFFCSVRKWLVFIRLFLSERTLSIRRHQMLLNDLYNIHRSMNTFEMTKIKEYWRMKNSAYRFCCMFKVLKALIRPELLFF